MNSSIFFKKMYLLSTEQIINCSHFEQHLPRLPCKVDPTFPLENVSQNQWAVQFFRKAYHGLLYYFLTESQIKDADFHKADFLERSLHLELLSTIT